VILYLSSWTKKQAGLGEWLQAELVRLYKVGPDRARQWVEGRDILPLLDGLDELAKDQRADCVEAINTWSDLKSLAVCCRLEEYRKLPVALSLAGAVVVEPLEREEVESYLKKHGSKLQSVRQALQDDPKLWDLMKTPLMLSVLFWASAVEWDEARNEPDLRRRLYLRFVYRMFDRHQNSRFDKKKACRWLGWLAAQLVNRDQIPFALEDLDWEWLPSRRARRAASVIFGLVFGLVGGLFFGLDAILRPAAVSERSAANEGTSRSLLYAVRISSAGVVLAIAVAWLLSVPRGGLEGAMSGAVEAATAAAPAMVAWLSVFLALQKGGFFFLRHWAVRAQLQRLGLAPRHYVKFLDEAAAMLFLRKTGGTYQFFHVTFRDFVAETYGAEWLAKDRRPPPPKQAAST
jgi:hypothetical protein